MINRIMKDYEESVNDYSAAMAENTELLQKQIELIKGDNLDLQTTYTVVLAAFQKGDEKAQAHLWAERKRNASTFKEQTEQLNKQISASNMRVDKARLKYGRKLQLMHIVGLFFALISIMGASIAVFSFSSLFPDLGALVQVQYYEAICQLLPLLFITLFLGVNESKKTNEKMLALLNDKIFGLVYAVVGEGLALTALAFNIRNTLFFFATAACVTVLFSIVLNNAIKR